MKGSGIARLLFTCGNGETGKLGLGGIFSTTLFTACWHLPEVDVLAVSCGNAHTAAVTDCGTVFTCGSNEQLQLGHRNDVKEVPVPLEVDIPERIVSVSAGGAFNLAIAASGAVYGWGDNRFGQVGTNDTAAYVAAPTRLQGLPKIVAASAGDRHALALSEDGEVMVWGANHSGQLGIEHTGLRSWFQSPQIPSPRLVKQLLPSESGSKATSIAAGSGHSLVATQSGGLYGMGTNKWWQLGLPQSEHFYVPTLIPTPSSVVQIQASTSTSAALDKHGQLLMWGTDTMSSGILPEREQQEPLDRAFKFAPQYREPTAVKAVPFSDLGVGFAAGAGVTTHGRLSTWGWSGYTNEGTSWLDRAHGAVDDGCQLGHGIRLNVNAPTLVNKLALDCSGRGNSTVSFEEGERRMYVESVSCGLDHMAAVVVVDRSLLEPR